MPLNLAQTAISALKIGENALTAIYSGITRVYPNDITVSIDGANASSQSGTAGQPMNPLIYIVTPSNASNYGWTTAQISAATLTGLPAGFTATFSSSGSLGSQTGTWTITTTDGNFPNTDAAITVASLTSTISETYWGTLAVSWSGNVDNGTVNYSEFLGTTITATRNNPSSGWTPVGQLYTNVTIGTGIQHTSGQAPSSTSLTGVGDYKVTASAVYTINSIGTTTTSLTVGIQTQASGSWTVDYQVPSPPWSSNPSTGIQTNVNVQWVVSSPYPKDPRQAYRIEYEWTNTQAGQPSSGTGTFGSAVGAAPQANGSSSIFYSTSKTGQGSYTIKVFGNSGITGATYASAGGNAWNFSSPAVTKTWNWT